jgi:hypothetical protein
MAGFSCRREAGYGGGGRDGSLWQVANKSSILGAVRGGSSARTNRNGCRADKGWKWTSWSRWVARVAPGPAVLASLGESVHLPASERVIAALAPIIGGQIRDCKSVLRQGAAP